MKNIAIDLKTIFIIIIKMENYKREFVEFLLAKNALRVFEDPKDDRALKSKRPF